MRRQYEDRLEKQRLRQQAYRAQKAKRKRPDRDDFAQVALRWLILDAASKLKERPEVMTEIEIRLLDEVERLGFDREEADQVLGDLIDKYSAGWDFLTKRYLTDQNQ